MDNMNELIQSVNRIDEHLRTEKLYQYPYEFDETTTANVTYVRYVRDSIVDDDTESSAILCYDESGATTIIGWADGNRNFDNIWTNRAALTYKQLNL